MREINPFGLRMPVELRKKLEAITKKTKRSLNSEIITRLEGSLEDNNKPVVVSREELKQLIGEAIEENLNKTPR